MPIHSLWVFLVRRTCGKKLIRNDHYKQPRDSCMAYTNNILTFTSIVLEKKYSSLAVVFHRRRARIRMIDDDDDNSDDV